MSVSALGKHLSLTAAMHFFSPRANYPQLCGTWPAVHQLVTHAEGWQGRRRCPTFHITHTHTHILYVEARLLWKKGTGGHLRASIISHKHVLIQALLVQKSITDDHLRAPIISHLCAHTRTNRVLAHPSRGFFLFPVNCTVAKCPFDVCSASWENIACCMCHHKPERQEWSSEEKLGVRGLLLSYVLRWMYLNIWSMSWSFF